MFKVRHLTNLLTISRSNTRLPVCLSTTSLAVPKQSNLILTRLYSEKTITSRNKRAPSLQECPPPNLTTNCPEGENAGNDGNKDGRKKYSRILAIGLLVSAATVAAVYFAEYSDKPKSKSAEEKKKKLVNKIPADSKKIPNNVPYLLIGGGTASFAAFRAIKSTDPKAKVLVVAKEPHFPYMRPPLSKEIWYNDDKECVNKLIFKQWNGSERSLFYEPDDFYTNCEDLMKNENGGVAVVRGWTVTHLDPVEKVAYLDDGASIKYEKCLIATGAKPKMLPVFEAAIDYDQNVRERVKLFRNIEDFQIASELFENAKSVAVIGGGFLGSELACALARKGSKSGKKVYQIFRESGNMSKILPEYLSFWTTDKVQSEGVNVLCNSDVGIVRSTNKGLELELKDGNKVNVDLAIVAAGVEPNTNLAKKSNLEVDPEIGGYLVNAELQARSNLYIAGDCSCFYDPLLGRRRIEHHDHAVVSGRLAGENMTGASKPYTHQSMFWSDLGPEVGYEAIGLVDSTLPTVGVFAKGKIGEGSGEKEECTDETRKRSLPKQSEGEDFSKGVIFYLKNDIVVGIVLWNVFNRMSIARQVLKDQKKYDDLNEVAKLFSIHEE